MTYDLYYYGGAMRITIDLQPEIARAEIKMVADHEALRDLRPDKSV